VIISSSFKSGYSGEYLTNLASYFTKYYKVTYLQHQEIDINQIIKINISANKQKLTQIRDEVILIDRWSEEIPILSLANQVYLLSYYGSFTPSLLLTIPYIDGIIVPTTEIAYRLGIFLSQKDVCPNIFILKPIVEEHKRSDIPENNQISCLGEFGQNKNFEFIKHKRVTQSSTKETIATIIDPNLGLIPVFESILYGRPVIFPRFSRVPECMIDGFNCGIYNNINYLDAILSRTSLHLNESIIWVETIMQSIIDDFKSIVGHYILPIKIQKKSFDYWIVPKIELNQGEAQQFPESYNQTFKILQLSDLVEIFEFFQDSNFQEVYVFSVSINDLDYKKINQVRMLASRIGFKTRKIHICTDEDWSSSSLNQILSIIPTGEGIKQIS